MINIKELRNKIETTICDASDRYKPVINQYKRPQIVHKVKEHVLEIIDDAILVESQATRSREEEMMDERNLSDECMTCPYRTHFGLYQCLTEPINGPGEPCTVPWDILDSIEIRRNNKSQKVSEHE